MPGVGAASGSGKHGTSIERPAEVTTSDAARGSQDGIVTGSARTFSSPKPRNCF